MLRSALRRIGHAARREHPRGSDARATDASTLSFMKPSRLFMTSVHEAGHGIMAILVGFHSRYVTNLRDATSLGRMYWAPGQRAPFRRVLPIATSEERARALVFVAGVAAERVLLGTDARLASIDAEKAREFVQTAGAKDETVEILLSDAEKVFADEHVRNATLTIAHQLRRDRVVLGADIEAIIEGVGLMRGDAVLLRAALGRTVDDEVGRRPHGRGVLGNAGFIDSTSTRYFFRNN